MRRVRLPHHTAQLAFSVVAVAVAIALPVVLLSVGGGVSQHELYAIEHAGFEIEVDAAGVHGVGEAHRISQQIGGLPEVAGASPILSVSLDAFGGSGGPTPALAEGVIPGPFEVTMSPTERTILPSALPLGDPTDQLHYANGTYQGPSSNRVLVSGPLARSLGVSIGSTILLSPTALRSDARAFVITAIVGTPPATLGATAANALVLPLSDLQVLTGYARSNGSAGPLVDAADSVQVALVGPASTDPSAVARVARSIQALFPFYSVSTLSDQAHSAREAAAVLTGFYLLLSSVGLAVGLVFLGLVLVRRVETERRAIGIRRALGVPRGQIALWMARRAATLATAGTVAGVATGWILVRLFAAYGSTSVRIAVGYALFDPPTLLALALGVVLLSVLASLAATRAALRISIAEALR